jgi:hypothetical protein
MKTILLLTVFVIALWLFTSSSAPPETHVITLNVDTGKIDNRNVDNVSDFGQPENVPNQEFTIDVNVGDIVLWKGVSSNAPDTDLVMIEAINHEGGVNVFDRNVLKDTPQNPGVVVGTIKKGKSGDVEKYKISFKIFNAGVQRNGTFHIDPKIIVR